MDYQQNKCKICGEIYEDAKSAMECESSPAQTHSFNIGDEVLLVVKYPENDIQFFAKRTITKLVWVKESHNFIHRPAYALDKIVNTGKALYEGAYPSYKDEDGLFCEPASESSLYKIGQLFSFYTGEGEGRKIRPITWEDVNLKE